MKPQARAAFVRNFHKYSGLLLILLVSMKLFTGFESREKFGLLPAIGAMRLHTLTWIDLSLTLLFLFHASYGIFKIFLVRGISKRARAFVLTNLVPGVLFLLVFLFVYLV